MKENLTKIPVAVWMLYKHNHKTGEISKLGDNWEWMTLKQAETTLSKMSVYKGTTLIFDRKKKK